MGDGVSGGIKAVGKGNFLLFLKYLENQTIIHQFQFHIKYLGKDFNSTIEACKNFFGLKHIDRCEWGDQSCQQWGGRNHRWGQARGHWGDQ